jgi:quercetin dioxygenase-like cupin family protein
MSDGSGARATRAGEVYENPVTGERVVVRSRTPDADGGRLVVDLHLRPGAAVAGEHYHPGVYETFAVVRGRVGFRLDGQERVAGPGDAVSVPAGVPHDWWNAGPGDALVRVEVAPAARFEQMILNLFGLAQDGRVNRKGMPGLLQLAALAREFDDVIRFTRPPRAVQWVVFRPLAALARLLGYRGSYPEYLARGPSAVVPVPPHSGTPS